MPEPEQKVRSTFGPVVLLGLLSGALTAVSSTKPWMAPDSAATGATDGGSSLVGADPGKMPLAAALGFVLLACWGVLLVTRGRVRRVFAVIAVLSALGVVATVIDGFVTLPDVVRKAYADLQVSGSHFGIHFTGWIWASALGALVSVGATVLAVRYAPSWPAMGSRYDAPGTQSAPAVPENDRDLWDALDEGHDPTVQREP